jgi:hypothetical protein
MESLRLLLSSFCLSRELTPCRFGSGQSALPVPRRRATELLGQQSQWQYHQPYRKRRLTLTALRHRRRLIRLDDTVFGTDEAWALKLRDVHHIGDFRRWREPDAYRKALGRLLRDLGVEKS